MKQLSGPDVLAMQAQTPLLLDVREPWEFASCHHGMRSAQVVAFLERQGFDAAYNLAGGIDAWSEQVDASVPRH